MKFLKKRKFFFYPEGSGGGERERDMGRRPKTVGSVNSNGGNLRKEKGYKEGGPPNQNK